MKNYQNLKAKDLKDQLIGMNIKQKKHNKNMATKYIFS